MAGNVELVYAIGDIHGMLPQLQELLHKIKVHADGRSYGVVVVGDMVDRGPSSRGVLELLKSLQDDPVFQIEIILGNHEDLMIRALHGNREAGKVWTGNGGIQTMMNYDASETNTVLRAHVDWLKTLPVMVEMEHHVFVHAGVSKDYALKDQPEAVLLWSRKFWEGDPDMGKHVLYGHTPTDDGYPRRYENSTGLDTGCHWSGRLLAAIINPNEPGPPIGYLHVDGEPAK